MNRLGLLVLLLGAFASIVAAASAPTFCKCTCFSNSTIIEIKSKSTGSIPGSHLKDPEGSDDADETSPAEPSADPLSVLEGLEDDQAVDPIIPRSPARRAQASPSCSQCNRAFCLSQSLPICKGAAEKDVVTMCFQRDSRQDQIIVWGFILGTAGLLGYAALRKVLELQESGGGLVSGLAGGLLRGGNRGPGVLPVGREGLGATGSDGARGRYETVAGHSRDGSGLS